MTCLSLKTATGFIAKVTASNGISLLPLLQMVFQEKLLVQLMPLPHEQPILEGIHDAVVAAWLEKKYPLWKPKTKCIGQL